jgi:predicted enzyme related to lactoylglutathione lyase
MKYPFTIFLLAALLLGCNNPGKNKSSNMTKTNTLNEQTVIKDTMPRVTGVGGIFFQSEDPEKAKEWYVKNLGLVTDEYGGVFEFRNANRPKEKNYLRWSLFKKGSGYFNPSKKEFMINYTVQNIEGLVKNLKKSGVTILDTIESYDYGKFLHIMDSEGNKIELWEPVDSVLTKMNGKTNK